jgi:hypothetical protein
MLKPFLPLWLREERAEFILEVLGALCLILATAWRYL